MNFPRTRGGAPSGCRGSSRSDSPIVRIERVQPDQRMPEEATVEHHHVSRIELRVAKVMTRYRRDFRIVGQEGSQIGRIQHTVRIGAVEHGESRPELALQGRLDRAAPVFEDMVVDDDEPHPGGRNGDLQLHMSQADGISRRLSNENFYLLSNTRRLCKLRVLLLLDAVGSLFVYIIMCEMIHLRICNLSRSPQISLPPVDFASICVLPCAARAER